MTSFSLLLSPRLGTMLRIRLPSNFTVIDGPRLTEPQVANSLISLGQITRDAVSLWQNSNRFLENLNAGVLSPYILNEAHRRSMKLLHSWLTPRQLASFRRREYFEVTGGSSGVKYRLYPRYSFGIKVLEGKRAGQSLCVIPRDAPALGDILLAQKIGLETNEEETLRLANVT